MLTDKELNKIWSWLPYRDDWPIDSIRDNDDIENHYSKFITSLTKNKLFDTYYSQDGGMTNYLEFICHPTGYQEYRGNAIMVCISLCAPIATYGQTTFSKTINSWGYDFIDPSMVGVVTDTNLQKIENEIVKILTTNNLTLIDKEFANKSLPKEVADSLKGENNNHGEKYLHGIFQWND